VGISILNASQAHAVAEMQIDSEDMLFYAPDAIFVISLDGEIEMANQRALGLVERDADTVIGALLFDVLGTSPERPTRLREIAEIGGVLEVETHCLSGTRLAALTLSFIGDAPAERILCVVRDITAERQASLALRRTERATLMGQAVEYLLHEVNNPLAALISNLSVANKQSDDVDAVVAMAREECFAAAGGGPAPDMNDVRMPKLKKALRSADTAAQRIKETMDMLRSAHRGEASAAAGWIDIAYELTLAVGVAEAEVTGDITFVKEIETKRQIRAPSLAIAEAVGALIKNAVQALEGRPRGYVRIWARESSDSAIISVSDNGPGVAPSIREQVFMPFFTTKALGEALGLGLTLADDTVRRLGGDLRLAPSFDLGATFEMSIPLDPRGGKPT
jgi:signal transduction histidine kinase